MNDKTDIIEIANQASLKFISDDKNVSINHKFSFSDKSTWGLIFLIGFCIFVIGFSFFKPTDNTSKILGVFLGSTFLLLTSFALLRELTDKLKITEKELIVRYKLKSTSVPIDKKLKVKMKTEIRKIRRIGTIGSDFILVSHFIQTLDKEIPIFYFQMDNSNANKANKLGNYITQLISNRQNQKR
jgi:hypothetical protein